MTSKADRQDAVPMLAPDQQPDLYRLLSVFSGVPVPTLPALIAAGLHSGKAAEPISEQQRTLLRMLSQDRRIQWVTWGPDGPGYVLTGIGEEAVKVYAQRYGPAHARRRWPPMRELLVFELLEAFDTTSERSLKGALVEAEIITAKTDVANIYKQLLATLVHVGYLTRSGDGYVRTEAGQDALQDYQRRTPQRPGRKKSSGMRPRKDLQ
ncbi:hypothetical protein [Deinococcus soli (ex Cha et al. 2016)]|uniref:hypothetical protein n=1 Tax=Deinococcus soli (ex Cha et al. 2016) TaxID=1309411 RepID=UPI001669431E|nr:hypothetical protein [Deinococcus soli (ex Cha et al. 2016)]GGB64624.1 hypothetical protein GCM10008019_20920 [Deinococcus soli (ex Cha et al. 2016)]